MIKAVFCLAKGRGLLAGKLRGGDAGDACGLAAGVACCGADTGDSGILRPTTYNVRTPPNKKTATSSRSLRTVSISKVILFYSHCHLIIGANAKLNLHCGMGDTIVLFEQGFDLLHDLVVFNIVADADVGGE